MLSSLIVTFVYNLVQASLAQGQTTKAVCRKEYDWMSNSMQQNPCWVTSWLWVPCYGTGNNSELDPLKPGWFYSGPKDKDVYDSTPCDCNTVLYSTYAACAICQGGDIDTWPIYRTNCSQVYNGSYPEPVPGGTAIPAWAFLDVVQNSTFNVVAAKALADQNVPDFTGNKTSVPLATNTSSSLTSSITATNANPSPSSSAGSAPVGAALDSTHGSDVGAVAGAAVGGTIGVLLTGALIVFVIVRHRRKTKRSRSDSSSCSDTTVVSSENVLSPTSMKSAKSTMLYDVNDPRTYPPPFGSQSTPSISSGAATVAQYPAIPSPGVGGPVSFYRGFPQV